MSELNIGLQWLAAALLVLGGVFALVGAIGMLRFPDFFMRLHAPTKATTLGVGGVLLASMVLSWGRGEIGLQALLVTLFMFITAPVSANLMAQAAMHLRVPSRAGPPPATSDGPDASEASNGRSAARQGAATGAGSAARAADGRKPRRAAGAAAPAALAAPAAPAAPAPRRRRRRSPRAAR